MTRNAVLCWLLVVLLGGELLARPGVVKTHDGQTYEGEVDERDPAAVVIVVRGIQTRIDRSRVASITYSGDKQQELRGQLAKLGPKDVPGRVALARAAMADEQYVIARDVLEQARQIDPNNAEVVQLLETVQSQIRMQRNTGLAHEARQAPATETSTAPTQPAGDVKLLRAPEINTIKQAEARYPEDNLRIRFERNVLRRFVDYVGRDELPNFFSLNALQQANLIVQKGPPEMAQDVTILNDPPALRDYRRVIQPFIVQNCASVACHGGGGTKLHIVTPADSDAAAYTNFYTITKYVKEMPASDAAVFGGANPRLVDRQRPEQSLLVQYSLPGAISEFDHPDVRDYRPPLRSKTDPRFRQLVDWMGVSLKPVDPRYTFEPVTTQPATQAETQPAPAVAAPAQPPPPARPLAPRPAVRPVSPPPPPDGVLR
jgi:hypothetical protein